MFRKQYGLNLAFVYSIIVCVTSVEIRLTVTRQSKLVLLPGNNTRFQELLTAENCDWQVVLDGAKHLPYIQDHMFTPNEECITSLFITNSPSIAYAMCHAFGKEFTQLQNLTISNNTYMTDLCISSLPPKLQYLNIKTNRLMRLSRFPFEQRSQLIEVAADGNQLNQVDYCLVDTNWHKRLNVPRASACNCNKIKLIGRFLPSSSAYRLNSTDAAICSQWCKMNKPTGTVSHDCLCLMEEETANIRDLCNSDLYKDDDETGALIDEKKEKTGSNNPLMFTAIGIGCAVVVAAVVVGTMKLSNRSPGVITAPKLDGLKNALEFHNLFGTKQTHQPVDLIQRRPAFNLENPCHPVTNLDRPNSELDMRSMDDGLGLRQKTSEGTLYRYGDVEAQSGGLRDWGGLPSHVDGTVLDMLPFKPEVEILRNGMAVPSVEIRRPSNESLSEPNDSILPNLEDLDQNY